MDITFARLKTPQLRATFRPVYWEPITGGHDKLTALIALVPELESAGHFAPAAHCILPQAKLRAIFGTNGGTSAHGILRTAAEFMTQQLAAGLAIDDLSAPFMGFSFGTPREVRGFSAEQLLTAAVQMVSMMGSVEELMEEVDESDARRTTLTTRKFLRDVKRKFAGDNKELKGRFNRKYRVGPTTDVTLDYQHDAWLVQFASLPISQHQTTYLEGEAETKLLEVISARQTIEAPTKPLLIINSQSLLSHEQNTVSAAKSSLERVCGLAKIHSVATFSANSDDLAVKRLIELIA